MSGNIFEYYVKRKKAPKAAEKAALYGAALAEAKDVAALVRKLMGKDEAREHFIVLYLSCDHKVVGYDHHAIGADNEVHVYPREVYRAALLAGAVDIILAHNHPSGACDPSPADDELTRRLKSAGELLGIRVLDHVVVTDKSFFSYADKRRL